MMTIVTHAHLKEETTRSTPRSGSKRCRWVRTPIHNPPGRKQLPQATASANARSDIHHRGIGHVPYSGEGIVHVFDHREQEGEDARGRRH